MIIKLNHFVESLLKSFHLNLLEFVNIRIILSLISRISSIHYDFVDDVNVFGNSSFQLETSALWQKLFLKRMACWSFLIVSESSLYR